MKDEICDAMIFWCAGWVFGGIICILFFVAWWIFGRR